MSLALELSSRRCIILTQWCGYSKQPWVQLFPMLASINKSISCSWLGFLLSVVNLLQCSLLHCNLKFLDCKLTIIIVFPKSLQAHAANVSPNRSIFGKYMSKQSLSSGNMLTKSLHYPLDRNLFTSKLK